MRLGIKIYKDGRHIADADAMQKVITTTDKYPGIRTLFLWYFPTIKMTPPVVFEHLAGQALVRFLDRCSLLFQEQDDDGNPVGDQQAVEFLRYVHGRSEVMKGQPKISAVLLARLDCIEPLHDIPMADWIGYMPAIYTHFLEVVGTDQKSA